MKLSSIIAYFIPVLLSLIGLILSTLCLYAGHERGFMEDFALARLNTSMIGQNLTNIGNDGSPKPPTDDPIGSKPGNGDDPDPDDNGDHNGNGDNGRDDTLRDIFDFIRHILYDLLHGIQDRSTTANNNNLTYSATQIGLPSWYSFHVMTACQGDYIKDHDSDHFKVRTANCTHDSPGFYFNLTELLLRDLRQAGHKITFQDHTSSDKLQHKLDILNKVLTALAAFYIMSMIFCALALLASLAALFSDSHNMSRVNVLSALLATLWLFIASVMATATAKESASEVTKVGREYGILAHNGGGFLGLTWGAFVAMFVDIFFALGHLRRTKRMRGGKKGKGEKDAGEGVGDKE